MDDEIPKHRRKKKKKWTILWTLKEVSPLRSPFPLFTFKQKYETEKSAIQALERWNGSNPIRPSPEYWNAEIIPPSNEK